MEIEKIGMNVRRHKELIIRLSELVDASASGEFISTSQLIDLIAEEPTFTKKDCVYLGLYLATSHRDTKEPTSEKEIGK
jgi:hypothetical protein